MKDKTITRKISQGMYVLTTIGGGCVVDAVSQVSAGDNPLISVAVMKSNYTNELMHNTDKFAISILGIDLDPKVIETFGMHSMRDYDKFANFETIVIDDLHIIPNSLGYMICEKVDMIENDTHTIFIGRLIEADKFSDNDPMTYGYYQEHKNEIMKVQTEKGKTAWVCTICGHIYYGENIPEDYICPVCGAKETAFTRML